MRCLCPPENSCGKRSRWSRDRPTFSSSAAARSSCSEAVPIPCSRRGWVRISRTFSRGFRLAYGSWKNDLHVLAVAAQVGVVQSHDIHAVKSYASFRSFFKPQQRAPYCGLPRPAFTDEANHFSGHDVERDVVHSLNVVNHPFAGPPPRIGKYLRRFSTLRSGEFMRLVFRLVTTRASECSGFGGFPLRFPEGVAPHGTRRSQRHSVG